MQLNKEQKQAVEHLNGPCIVTAVPGSGKTRALTSRIVRLVERGIDPNNILAVTFTNKAADEMKSRVAKLIGQQSSKIWISTFHGLCLAIIRKYGVLIDIPPNFTIYNDSDQKELLTKIARMHEYEDCGKNEVARMQRMVNDFRENLDDVEPVLREVKPIEVAVIKEYLGLLREFNAVDFSDILYQAWRLVTKHKAVADKLFNKFKYVLEDEGQDANRIQYEILKAIAPPPKGNLFIVADLNQSIFSWRGARPENLQIMETEYEEVHKVTLPRNYRSTSEILSGAQSLIRNNPEARDVELHSNRGSGRDITVRSCLDPDNESELIVNHINHLRALYAYGWNDFAVLYRVNQLSKVPEIVFRQRGIPYRIIGGFSFFDRSEIRTALAYWSFFANPYDTISFSRAISNPKRGVGEVIIGRLERFCQDHQVSMLEACERLDEIDGVSSKARKSIDSFVKTITKHKKSEASEKLSVIASSLLKETGYYEYLQEESKNDPHHKRRIDNLDELLTGIGDFEAQKENASIADYLQSIRLFADLSNPEEEDQAVTLLTMHASKGREWASVHIIGAEEGYIPHTRSIAERGMDEERRLMYVAMTRAASDLHISYCEVRRRFDIRRKKNVLKPCRPSCFLDELI